MTNLKTRTTNLNKITRARRPLATARGIPRLALTALLTLAPLGLALGAVTVAPGVASAASCSAFLNAPMSEWVWTGSALYFVPEGESPSYGGELPMPSGVTFPSSWLSQPIDNPAPIIWLYEHGAQYGLPTSNISDVFSSCTTYTPQIVAKMTSEGFSPAQVGGVNPPGMTAPTAPTTTTTTKPTASTVPPSGTVPQPKPSTGPTTVTPAPSPQPTSEPPQSLTPSTPSASAWQHYLTIIKSDQIKVSAGSPPTSPSARVGPVWPYIAGGVALALVAGVIAVLVRRRSLNVDQTNSKYGGRRF